MVFGKYLVKFARKHATKEQIERAERIADSICENNETAMAGKEEIIALVLVCIVLGYVFPVGLQALAAMNTTGLSPGVVGLLGAIPVIIVVVVFMKITE